MEKLNQKALVSYTFLSSSCSGVNCRVEIAPLQISHANHIGLFGGGDVFFLFVCFLTFL